MSGSRMSCRSTAVFLAVGLITCFGMAGAQAAAPQPNIRINDVTVTEGPNTTAAFTVSIDRAPARNRDLTVQVATQDGSAIAGQDFGTRDSTAQVTRTLTFTRNGALTQTFSVPILNDTVPEPTKTFNVLLSAAQNGVIADSTGVGTIQDDDTPTLSVNDVTVSEATPNAQFTVTLNGPHSNTVTVAYATANGPTGTTGAVAGQDYTSTSGTLSFPASTAATQTLPISVPIINDTAVELTETFSVNLSGATNATIARAIGTGTINDNDQPSLSINDAPAVSEGATNPRAVFTVTLTGAHTNTVTVAYATANGPATNGAIAGSDFTTTSGTLSFPASTAATQTLTISVPIINDTLAEATETFFLNLSSPSGATITDAQGVGTITDDDGGAVTRPNVSINSTSQNRPNIPTAAVTQQAAPVGNNSNSSSLSDNVTLANGTGRNNFQVLAVNDLGMHCGDLDTRVASILPPFNVLHAVAIQKGAQPVKLTEAQVEIHYSAASSTTDPVLTRTNPSPILDPSFTGVYKTNFWDIARTAYAPFYPGGFLAGLPDLGVDIGLPVPDVETFYTTTPPTLLVDQQQMPGRANTYVANAPQVFSQFVGTQFFFTNIKNKQGVGFGYTSQVNWFEAAGIPISTFDDAGRENAYPLMRVQAVAKTTIGTAAAGTVLATLDAVIPVSGEADCKACHGHPNDGGNGTATTALGSNVAQSFDDPQGAQLPLPVSQEWATDVNILRLHDLRHATSLEATAPVVCQTCHYTPALDLAQFGPNTPEENAHKSMSAVMHKTHGDLKNNGFPTLFPDMPPRSDPQRTNATTGATFTQTRLQETCYMCHPGRRTQCMRGAMGQAGVVCQDCHGQMSQVGTDFSRNVSPTNPGAFEIAGDFYTNSATPRVPWANEPGCGSCHTGDAVTNGRPAAPAGQSYLLSAAPDGIRLLQAYRTGDAKATPIVPTNKRFAEDTTAIGNPKLYRVSAGGAAATGGGASGHGGLFCESCHGSTHAEWAKSPVATLANANDNKTPQQLQGHNGTIIECRTCHGTAYDGTAGIDLNNPLNPLGPHGMHPVGNDTTVTTDSQSTGPTDSAVGPAVTFVNGGHHNTGPSGRSLDRNLCRTCHGATGQGTVLSETKAPRWLHGARRATGFRVTCSLCHSSPL